MDFVYHNKLKSSDSAIVHSGDNQKKNEKKEYLDINFGLVQKDV